MIKVLPWYLAGVLVHMYFHEAFFALAVILIIIGSDKQDKYNEKQSSGKIC